MPLKVILGHDRKLNRLIESATPVEYRKGKTIHRRGDDALRTERDEEAIPTTSQRRRS